MIAFCCYCCGFTVLFAKRITMKNLWLYRVRRATHDTVKLHVLLFVCCCENLSNFENKELVEDSN